MANQQQQETFNNLMRIMERDYKDKPANETDSELLAQLRQCDVLRPEQTQRVLSTAIEVYDRAIQRNTRALKKERDRLQAQINKLQQELNRNQTRSSGIRGLSAQERKESLFVFMLQVIRLNEDSKEREEKSK